MRNGKGQIKPNALIPIKGGSFVGGIPVYSGLTKNPNTINHRKPLRVVKSDTDLKKESLEAERVSKVVLPEFKISLKCDELHKPFKIKNDYMAAAVSRSCFNEETIDWIEQLVIVAIGKEGSAIGFYNAGIGGRDSVPFDVKIIMQFALLSNAEAIIVAHNHPSGSLTPSQADICCTEQLRKACNCLNVVLADHFIITRKAAHSILDGVNYFVSPVKIIE